METLEGTLLDVYNLEEEIHVWVKHADRVTHLLDRFYPVIFADGPVPLLVRLVARLREMGAVRGTPVWTIRRHFYKNEPVRVLKIQIQKPSVLHRIRTRLYALYGKIDLYHSDIELPTAYMFARNIFPLCLLRIQYTQTRQGNIIHKIESLDKITALDYTVPDFKTVSMRLEKTHRLGLSPANPLILETRNTAVTLSPQNEREFLVQINEVLQDADPDVVLSSFGDQVIFPALFTLAQKHGIALLFDRHGHTSLRKIIKQGKSFNTYGSWIFRAASYPLFGRLHVDAQNSFVFKEAKLTGILELARLARTPIQRMTRQSTGGALTAIETNVAIRKKYLVPWQKSAVERPKTAYELLTVDKGGLIYVPDASQNSVFENTAQLDFSQMYPMIMVNHNISPECVNCPCCAGDPSAPRVPEASYHICKKRRGIVADALAHILDRRKYYKSRIKELKAALSNGQASKDESAALLDNYETRQSSLKWMLVTSFGYLGYRNAKFGRIESHESVTAFGREKILTAKEIAEEHGYAVLHAITDCIFLHREGCPIDQEELRKTAQEITDACGIEMSIEGIYSWVIFLPSRQDPALPVVNRYCGRFETGELKYRGIAARRKDIPEFHRTAQLELLGLMAEASTIEDLRKLHPQMESKYHEIENHLRSGRVRVEELLLRKTASKDLSEYQVLNGTSLAMKQLAEMSLTVQPGEKVRYLVRCAAHPDRTRRYTTEEALTEGSPYDIDFYSRLLFECFQEIWQYFAPADYFNADASQRSLFSSV
jgi:DNA polymerase elongation subunit (family B)